MSKGILVMCISTIGFFPCNQLLDVFFKIKSNMVITSGELPDLTIKNGLIDA